MVMVQLEAAASSTKWQQTEQSDWKKARAAPAGRLTNQGVDSSHATGGAVSGRVAARLINRADHGLTKQS